MTVKPDLSKYRTGPVQNTGVWGRAQARERYGPMESKTMQPSGEGWCYPQRLGDDRNLQGPKYNNDTSGWVRAEGEDATTRPGFDKMTGGNGGRHHGKRA